MVWNASLRRLVAALATVTVRVGYVLDPEIGEAIPVRLPPQLSETGTPFLDGDRLVVARDRTGMALFELVLVNRD